MVRAALGCATIGEVERETRPVQAREAWRSNSRKRQEQQSKVKRTRPKADEALSADYLRVGYPHSQRCLVHIAVVVLVADLSAVVAGILIVTGGGSSVLFALLLAVACRLTLRKLISSGFTLRSYSLLCEVSTQERRSEVMPRVNFTFGQLKRSTYSFRVVVAAGGVVPRVTLLGWRSGHLGWVDDHAKEMIHKVVPQLHNLPNQRQERSISISWSK